MTNQAKRQPRQVRARRPEFSISSAVSGIVGCGSRVRSMAEQEEDIVNRVLGEDKSTVWHVCQNLRYNDTHDRSSGLDLGSYGPEFRRRSCWKPRGSRASAASSGSRASAASPPVGGDRKSRMSVARTQEAAPCGGPPSGRRVSKLVEKVIAKHRWSEQASCESGQQDTTTVEFSRGKSTKNSRPKQQQQRRSTSSDPMKTASTDPANTMATPTTLHSAPSEQQQPQQSLHPNDHATFSRSPSSSSSNFSSPSSIRRVGETAKLGLSGPRAGTAQDGTRRRIRFLPLAEALDRSSGDIGHRSGSGEDWDFGDLEIHRLVQRRRLVTLMRTSGRTSRPGLETNF